MALSELTQTSPFSLTARIGDRRRRTAAVVERADVAQLLRRRVEREELRVAMRIDDWGARASAATAIAAKSRIFRPAVRVAKIRVPVSREGATREADACERDEYRVHAAECAASRLAITLRSSRAQQPPQPRSVWARRMGRHEEIGATSCLVAPAIRDERFDSDHRRFLAERAQRKVGVVGIEESLRFRRFGRGERRPCAIECGELGRERVMWRGRRARRAAVRRARRRPRDQHRSRTFGWASGCLDARLGPGYRFNDRFAA